MLDIDEGISLVKFAAVWCAPCKALSGTVKKVSTEFSTVKFQDIDVDDNPELSKDYKIRSVPTVIVFKDGEEVARINGTFTAEKLRTTLREFTEEKAA